MAPDALVAAVACMIIFLLLLKQWWRHRIASGAAIRKDKGKYPEMTFQEFWERYFYPRHAREPYGAVEGLLEILQGGLRGISSALGSEFAAMILLAGVGTDALISLVVTANYLFGDGLTFGEALKVFASTMLSIPLATLVMFSAVWLIGMVWNMYRGITNVGKAKSEYMRYAGKGNGQLIVFAYWLKAVIICGLFGLIGVLLLGSLWQMIGILSPIFSYFNDTY